MKKRIPQNLKNWFHAIEGWLATQYYGHPAQHLTVIGVTGTDGKTTTSTLLYEICKKAGLKVALISTVAAFIGNEAVDTGFHVTTPHAFSLQRLLKRIKDLGFTHVVLEATSHGLDQHRLYGTNITYAVYTNITREHLDYHRTYERYVAAKAKLMKSARLVVLNRDDASYHALQTYLPKNRQVLSYSLKENKQPWWQSYFPQPYNQANALAALTLARAIDISDEVVREAFAGFKGVSGRMEEIRNNRGIRVIVDFAHTPNALQHALTAIKASTDKKVIAVYGAAGERDAFKRPVMGETGATLADEVILTAEDPRTEDVRQIIRQMKNGITTNYAHVHAIVDRKAAIDFAINHVAKPGDTVGIFGKGHERSMNLDGKHEIPWSDQAVARECLQQ